MKSLADRLLPSNRRLTWAPVFWLSLAQVALPQTPRVETVKLVPKTELKRLDPRQSLASLTYSPDGRILAVNEYGPTPRLFHAADMSLQVKLEGHIKPCLHSFFTQDGKRIVTPGRDGSVRVWDSNDGKQLQIFTEHQGPVRGFALSPDGKTVASGDESGTVGGVTLIWDLDTGKVRMKLPLKELPDDLAFSSDGARLAGAFGFDNFAKVFDLGSGTELLTLKFENRVSLVQYSKDGKSLISVSGDFATTGFEIRRWDSEKGQELAKQPYKGTHAGAVVLSPDNSLVAMTDTDRVRILRFEDLKELTERIYKVSKATRGFSDDEVIALAFTPDGKNLAVGTLGGSIEILAVERVDR